MAQPKRRNSTPVTALGPYLQGMQDASQPLTEMQRMFVQYLVRDKLNQTAAARQAGFNQPGTSAHALMRNPKVLAAIAERGQVDVGCDFCGAEYQFDPVDAAGLFTGLVPDPSGGSVH